MSKKIVYVDMDNVICDFDHTWESMFKERKNDIPKDAWDSYWHRFVKAEAFVNLPRFKDFEILVALLEAALELGHIDDIQILSSAGGRGTEEVVRAQKLSWLDENCISWKPNIVDHASLKKDFAHPSALLIDDYKRNTDQFIDAGGKAITYIGCDVNFITKFFKFLEI